jgi:hypothetical protein
MALLPCPYLGADVERTEERERHTAERHPDLLPEHRDQVVATLADPDEVRKSRKLASARLFTRWFDDVRGGKHVVVVGVSDAGAGRHWIVTAYIARRLAREESEWKRS